MLKLDRRKALGLSVASVAALRFAASSAATLSPLKAVVSLNGSSYTFSEDQGQDLGDFVSSIGGFTQRCIRATAAGCPLTVFFRPDRTSDRAEVVFELGTLFTGTPANLGAYTVTISRGTQQLAQISVPQHYWFSRWRWQSAARPIVGDVATLMSQNLLPPFNRTLTSTGGSTTNSGGSTTTDGGSTSTGGSTTTGGSTSTSGGSTTTSGGSTSTSGGSTSTSGSTSSGGSTSTSGGSTSTSGGSTSTSGGSTSGGSTSTGGSTSSGSGSVVTPPTLNKTLVKPISYSSSTWAPATAGSAPVSTGSTLSTASLPDGTFVESALLPVAFTLSSKKLTPAPTTGSTTTTSSGGSTTTTTTSGTTTGGSTTTTTTSGGATTGGSTSTTTSGGTTTSSGGSTSTSGSTTTTTSGSSTVGTTVGATFDISAGTYTVMGLAGVYAYMPTTGERPDIGIVTEQQAKYIVTGDQAALNVVMAQAEAAGSMPWHMRDENTGAPLNFETYPAKTWYPDAYGADRIRGTSNPVVLDTSHVPALTYLPYLLTGDPYYLEELQFQSNWDWGAQPASYRPGIPQARHFAWAMRSLFQVTRQTPSSAPAWLLPQTYWFNRLQGIRQWFETYYVNNTRPDKALIRTCTPIDSSQDEGVHSPGGTWIAVWQDEFVACILGWGVLMGFRDWQTAFDWKIGSTIARTSGSGGWIRAQATPYRVILRDTATSPFVTSWAQAYETTARINGITYTDPDTWVPSDMTYLTYTRGALVYAMAMGTPGASANLAWATSQITAKRWNTDYKWRLGTGL